MLPYVSMKDFDNIGDKLFEYAPVLGDDFTRIGQMAMNDALRDRVKTICDFFILTMYFENLVQRYKIK